MSGRGGRGRRSGRGGSGGRGRRNGRGNEQWKNFLSYLKPNDEQKKALKDDIGITNVEDLVAFGDITDLSLFKDAGFNLLQAKRIANAATYALAGGIFRNGITDKEILKHIQIEKSKSHTDTANITKEISGFETATYATNGRNSSEHMGSSSSTKDGPLWDEVRFPSYMLDYVKQLISNKDEGHRVVGCMLQWQRTFSKEHRQPTEEELKSAPKQKKRDASGKTGNGRASKKQPPNSSKNWGDLDSQTISVITSHLNLKEKAMVSSLNRSWLEASTCEKSVEIDPDEVGPNLDGVLKFVGSRFRHLQKVSIRINQRYFLDYGYYDVDRVPRVQLQGASLSSFFENCPPLLDLSIAFDDCVEEHTSRILEREGGLDTLEKHKTSLQSLRLVYTHFHNMQSLVRTIHKLENLKHLSLVVTSFDYDAYQEGGRMGGYPWQMGGLLTLVISSNMNQLRKLAIEDHGLVDEHLQCLIPILPQLCSLTLEGPFGTHPPSYVSLTDESLELIATHCGGVNGNLQVLGIDYNRRITSRGIKKVLKACPHLRELSATDTALPASDLPKVVEQCPTLRMIRYGTITPLGWFSNQEQEYLREASIASSGRTLFMGREIYEPTFDRELMKHHQSTKKAVEKLEANASNDWNEWAGWVDI